MRNDGAAKRAAAEQTAPLNLVERWALALLALGTVAILPGALNRFVFPKLAVVCCGLLLVSFSRSRGKLTRNAAVLLWIGIALLVAGALFGAAPLTQLLGAAPRYEGLISIGIYVGCAIVGARQFGLGRAPGATRWFLSWLSVAAILVGVEAVLEATGLRPLASNVARPGSLLGNASEEGAWAVLVLGPLVSTGLRVGGRLYLAGALGAAAALVCSGSRGALLGAGVMLIVLFATAPRREIRIVYGVIVVVLAVAAMALPATRARITESNSLAAQTVSGRGLLDRESLKLVGDHPLLGVGASGYMAVIPRYHTASYERRIGPQDPPDSPHNWLLQAACAGGIPLLLVALALAGLTLVRGYRAIGEQATGGESALVCGMLASVCGYGVALLFHFTSPGTTPLAAFFCGALLSERSVVSGPGAVSSRAGVVSSAAAGTVASRTGAVWAVRALLSVGLVVLVAAAVAEIPLRSAIDAVASGHVTRANHDFDLARTLRAWDPEIEQTAGHAYASLIGEGITAAVAPGRRWIDDELRPSPTPEVTLVDGATLAAASRQYSVALGYLERALAIDPRNPDVLADAGVVEATMHDWTKALADLRAAHALAPSNAAIEKLLEQAKTAAGAKGF